jgi:hypothetical protein
MVLKKELTRSLNRLRIFSISYCSLVLDEARQLERDSLTDEWSAWVFCLPLGNSLDSDLIRFAIT